MGPILTTNTDDEVEDLNQDFYDQYGNVCPGGLYDAGGHLVGQNLPDYISYLEDRFTHKDI